MDEQCPKQTGENSETPEDWADKQLLAAQLSILVDFVDRNIMPLDQTGPIG
ncbi:MAG: hypothetical protein WAP51_03145 [Candidatus Sungiibacteriota bacterium]